MAQLKANDQVVSTEYLQQACTNTPVTRSHSIQMTPTQIQRITICTRNSEYDVSKWLPLKNTAQK